MRAWLALALIALPLAACAQTRALENRAGQADSPQPPAFPQPQDYLPFGVSATSPFDFFVDAKSISFDNEGLVRYSLIAKSREGVLNVSYEGMSCSLRQYRVYAYGRPDNTWAQARMSQWQPIPADMRNAQRAVLHGEYFCSKSQMIGSAEDAVRALLAGPKTYGGGGGQ